MRILLFSLIFMMSLSASAFSLNIMQKIDKNGEIRIGFRDHLYPFSYIDKNGDFEGFAVDFARLLVQKLSAHFKKNIKLVPVKITTQNRFEKILNNDIDLEMGSTTYSFEREQMVDFSIIYFFSETTIIYNKHRMKNTHDIKGKIIGVTKNTTNYNSLIKFIKDNHLNPKKLILLDEHFDSVPLLEKGTIDAFCSDRTILIGILKKLKQKNDFAISYTPIGYEPYAFMMPENNSDFRDFVNNFLIWTVKTNTYFKIYKKWFKINNTVIPISPYLKEYLSVISYNLPDNWWEQ